MTKKVFPSPEDVTEVHKFFGVLKSELESIDLTTMFVAINQVMRNIFRANDITKFQVFPWDLLLLLKWCYVICPQRLPDQVWQEKQFLDFFHGKFLGILKLTTSIVRLGPFLCDDEIHTTKIVRLYCYQQFWLQNPVVPDRVLRPLMIMCPRILDGGAPSKLEELFLSVSGIELQHFLELCFMLHMRTIQLEDDEPPQLVEEFFQNCRNGYPEGTISKFLSIVSGSEDELRALATTSFELNDIHFQLAEQSPFREMPIASFLGKHEETLEPKTIYYEVGPVLLDELARDFSPYLFRQQYNVRQEFTNAFGLAFEDYIARGLRAAKVEFCRENDLLQNLTSSVRKGFRPADFVVWDRSQLMLISVKSNFAHGEAKINLSSAALATRFKNDVIGGIEQILSTAHIVRDQSIALPIPDKFRTKPIFAMVVTYEELFLYDAQVVCDEFGEEHLRDFMKKLGSSSWDPALNNILFLCASSFDKWIELLARRRIKLGWISEKARHQKKRMYRDLMQKGEAVTPTTYKMPFRRFLMGPGW